MPGSKVVFFVAVSLFVSVSAHAETATVYKIVGGDTIDVLLDGRVRRVRLAFIDAPEAGRRARCDRERQLGWKARETAAELLPLGASIELTIWPEQEKHRRLLASVTIGISDFGALMKRRGLAVPYDGQGPKPDWCTLDPATSEPG